MARLDTTSWMEELPWVVLGLRTTPKDDLYASTAELVYGAPLRLSGEFVSQSTADATATPETLQHLRRAVSRFQYTPATRHDARSMHIPRALQQAEYVYVRQDAARPALTPPYNGPYKVLERKDKTFIIEQGDKHDTVSIDRLKPAYLDPGAGVDLPRLGLEGAV